MKATTTAKTLMGCVLALSALLRMSAAELSATDQVRGLRVFATPLNWIGTAPTLEESGELLTALGAFQASGIQPGLAALEDFLAKHPDSTWAPSVRLNLAEYYRAHGRYSLALVHWERVWETTKQSKDEAGQTMAVRCFAGWSHLLASLGEKEKVKSLFQELEQLGLPLGIYSAEIESAHDGYIVMNSRPEISYRCGSYALAHVAEALHLNTNCSQRLFDANSPEGGFHISDLLVMAATNGLSVEAVRRPSGAEIIVPSVIHWRLNHYAAIVAEKNGRYKVIDPTFRSEIWMDAKTIDDEASGAFLVPTGKAPVMWAKLSRSESTELYGKGATAGPDDPNDDGPCDCPPCDDDDDNDSDDPAANDGPGDGSGTNSCPSDAGMPQWRVSEPYTTVWLQDTPLFYRQSNGKWMKLQLRYKHRGEAKGSTIGNFGPYWECNLIGFMEFDSGSSDVYVSHTPRGGVRRFKVDGTPDYKYLQKFHTSVPLSTGSSGGTGIGAPLFAHAPTLITPNGREIRFQFGAQAGLGRTNYFLTHRVDRYGRQTLLNQETIGDMIRVTNVVDIDGKALVFGYTNATFTNLITSATDPYGRSAYFKYDSQGRLTNITDMAGMSSSFMYNTGTIITNMTTPYGNYRFEYFSGSSATYGDTFRRATRITEPSGDQQLYTYCDIGEEGYRLSYHWNRAQYAAISSTGKANVLDMPSGDYLLGERKNWEHGANGSPFVSDTLSEKATAVNGSGNRNPVVYIYPSTMRRPTYSGSAATVFYTMERNAIGRPTVITFVKANQPCTYSNIFNSEGRILQTVWGPRGERTRAYGYHPVITNLLIAVTNAYNEVVRYTYDTNNVKLTSVTLPTGLVKSNVYIGSGTYKGFLTREIEIGVRTNSFGYANGNLVARTNELGLVITYQYDGLNRLVSTAFPDNTTISNVYNKLDLVATKDRLNQWAYFGYNSARQLVGVTNVAGQVTTYNYCSCGSPNQITRWNGNTPITTYYSYDMAGNLTNVTYPDGYQLNYTYNLESQVDSITDNGGHELLFTYATLGTSFKVSSVSFGGETLFTHTFDEYGRITQTIDRNGVTTTNGYDFLNRLTARRSIGTGGELTGLEGFTYDVNGLNSYTDASGNVTRYLRDMIGRVLYETNANSDVLGFTYNQADQLLTLTDGKNQTTLWNYDTFGRVTNKVDAANNVLFVYQYDPMNRLTNRWSAAKGNTGYRYDPVGNLTNVAYASGNTTNIVLEYDGLNRLTNMLDAVGSTTFGWTLGDQLASEDGPWASDTISYSYASRLRNSLNLAQPSGSYWTQSYSYDDLRRLTNVLSQAGSFTYNYPNGSDRIQYLHLGSSSSDLRISYTYDGLKRLTDTSLGDNSSIFDEHQYSYNAGNQRTQQVFMADYYGQFKYMNFAYDKIGQMQTAKGFDHTYDSNMGSFVEVSRQQEQFGYGYDKAQNLQFRTNNALAQTFNVDSRNQLTTASRTGAFTVAGTATEAKGGYISWGSPAGVTNVTVSGTGLSSGSADLYLDGSWTRSGATLTDGDNSYTATAQDTYGRSSTDSVTVNLPATNIFVYDLNGNLRTNNTRIYDYDDENQLIRITEPSAWKSEFTYDGMLRRRIRKEYTWSGGTWLKTNEMHYVYDARLVVEERDLNNLPLVTYTRGNDLSGTRESAGGIGGLLARTDHSSLITPHSYYLSDGNGNVTMLVSTNGAILARYNYDPYGNVLSMSGPLAQVNLYRFSSKEQHVNSEAVYFCYRYYIPSLQRWLNRDPIGIAGGVNLHDYVRNDPLNQSDAFGNCPLANPMNAEAFAPGSTGGVGQPFKPESVGQFAGFMAASIAVGAAVDGAILLAAEVTPTVLGWLGLGGAAATNPQVQSELEPMLAAINQSGQVILNPNISLSHQLFAQQALGIVGTELPPGTWVGTVGSFGNQVVALNSMTFYGNQALANPQVQQAIQEACSGK